MVTAMTEIIPRLWISGINTASNYNLLKKSKITHIITLTDNNLFPDIEYLSFNIEDTLLTNILDICINAADWIYTKLANLRHNILVQCNSGTGRSGAIIIAYLILKHGSSFTDAYTIASKRRHRISLNLNFVFQLKWLDYLFNKSPNEWKLMPYVSTTYNMTEFTTIYILFHTESFKKYNTINLYTSLSTIELPNSQINIIVINDFRLVNLVDYIKPTYETEYTLQVGHNEEIALVLLYHHLIINGYRKASDALSEISITPKELQLLLTYYETKVTPREQLIVKMLEISQSNSPNTQELLESFETYNIPSVVAKKKQILHTRSKIIKLGSPNMNGHQPKVMTSSSSGGIIPFSNC